MTTPHESDSIIAAWLEEGPTNLPESTRRAIAVATRTTTQHRRPLWAPWRTPLMNPLSRVAFAALAVVAIVGGGIYFLSPSGQVAGPSAAPPSSAPPSSAPSSSAPPSSAPPSPAPQGVVPTDWTNYTSGRFGYAMDYPTNWVATPATRDWEFVALHPEGNNLDRFGVTPTGAHVLVSSARITAEETSADRIAQLDAVNTACQLTDRHTVTIDGAAARQEEFFCFGVDYGIELVFASETRHYQVDLFSGTPLGETDRATFARFLDSFRFAETAASDVSAAIATVDQTKEAGYTIAIPSTWRSRTYPNGIFISAAAPITSGAMWFGGATAGEYVIDSGDAYGGSPFEIRGRTVDALLASVNSVYRSLNSSVGTAERQVTIDGEPAWVTEHEVAGPPTLWLDAVVIHGDRAYNFSLDAPPENAAELRSAFDEVVASIRWTT